MPNISTSFRFEVMYRSRSAIVERNALKTQFLDLNYSLVGPFELYLIVLWNILFKEFHENVHKGKNEKHNRNPSFFSVNINFTKFLVVWILL